MTNVFTTKLNLDEVFTEKFHPRTCGIFNSDCGFCIKGKHYLVAYFVDAWLEIVVSSFNKPNVSNLGRCMQMTG